MYSAGKEHRSRVWGMIFQISQAREKRPLFWAKRHYIQPLRSLLQGCTGRNIKKLYIFNSSYLLDSFSQSLKWSFLGVKKGLATSTLFSFRGFIILISDEHPRPFDMGVPSRAHNRGSQWGGGFYGYRLKFWLFYGYWLIFFSYG